MTNVIERKGRCLCGAVQLTARTATDEAAACHCGMCRRWGGGPFLAMNCGAEVVIDGEEALTVFGSSDWAERAFCSRCGSHVFYRLKDGSEYFVALGLFDDDDDVRFTDQIFIDEKPALYSFANETRTLTGAEIMAMYAPPTPER